MHRQFWDTVVILDEDKYPHPCCACCDIFLLWDASTVSHSVTNMSARGLEGKGHQISVEADQSGAETDFWSYGQPLVNVRLFKYPSRLLTATDDD